MMAEMFGLAYQLDAMDYAHGHFVPSDMSARQAEKAFAQAGLVMDFSGDAGEEGNGGNGGDGGQALMRELGGPGAGVSLGLVRVLAKFVAVSRNEVVFDDLKQVVALAGPPATVGVFYGAAHLPDMAQRLADQMGYAPTGEAVWLSAMRADPASTGMPPENVAMTKRFLQRAMDQALAQQRMMNRRRGQ